MMEHNIQFMQNQMQDKGGLYYGSKDMYAVQEII